MATVNLNRLADWRWQDNTYNDISGVGDNTAVTDHAKADDLIVCMTVRGAADACNKGSNAAVVKVQVSKDSGSYIDIASGSGDVRCVADTITGFTDHGTCVQKAANTLSTVCGTGFAGHSTQLNGDATAPSITLSSETWTEVQLLLDFTNAAAGSTYEFRVYNVTLGTAFAPDAVYGQGYPSVTIASPVQQTATPSDDISTAWTEVFEFGFGTFVEDDLSAAWTEVFAFASESILADNLSSDWTEVFVLGDNAFISDSLTFKGDVFYGGIEYAILAQDGDWIATQDGETIEYQWAPAAQTAEPSDNLSSAWTEDFEFGFGTTIEDDLSGAWTEVFEFAFGVFLEDDLSTAWTEVFEFAFGTTVEDDLSTAWTEVFTFASESILSDNLSGDWGETFAFAFGVFLEDDLSTAWTDEFTFLVTAILEDNLSGEWAEVFAFASESLLEDDLSGEWTELFEFDSEAIRSDDLSGDWTEVFAFASESLLSDDLSGDWTEVFAFAFGVFLEDDLSGDWTEAFAFAFGTTVEDDLSGDWTEVFEFAFGTTIEDDLSTAWTEDFNFGQQTATPSDDLSGDWTELFEFDSEVIRSDTLSGDWAEVFEFAFGTTVEDDLSGDWAEDFDFAFGVFLEDDLSGDWSDQMDAETTGAEVVADTLTWYENLSLIGGAGDLTILTQDGLGITAQDDTEIEYQYRTENAILLQDGDELWAQDGDYIRTQITTGAILLEQPLVLSEVLDALRNIQDTVAETLTFSEILSILAVTDDAVINESLTFGEVFVADVVKYPIKTEDDDVIRDADGFILEVQYEEDFLAPSDSLSFSIEIDFWSAYVQSSSDNLIFTEVLFVERPLEDQFAVINESISFYGHADIRYPVYISDTITWSEYLKYGIPATVADNLLFIDWASIADHFQYILDQFVFTGEGEAVWSEYTGAVFWFNDWYHLFIEFEHQFGDLLKFTETLTPVGYYDVTISALNAATEEDQVTPWTEEDGSAFSDERGYVDLNFDEKISFNPQFLSYADEIRFTPAHYTQEYTMPCPPATGPCTTEVTGSCAAPKTLSTSAGSVPSDFAVTGELFYLSFSWTPFASGSLRIFFRKKLTEEKWSTILVDGVDGSVETPDELVTGDYEGGVRFENDSYYSAWTPFEFEVPDYDDTITLTETIALLANRVRSRTDTLAFSDEVTTV